MIRVTIEMWPGGNPERRYLMHVIDIANDMTGSLSNIRKGDYDIRCSRKVGRSDKRVQWWRTARVEGFPRANKNAVYLLREALNQILDHPVTRETRKRVKRR